MDNKISTRQQDTQSEGVVSVKEIIQKDTVNKVQKTLQETDLRQVLTLRESFRGYTRRVRNEVLTEKDSPARKRKKERAHGSSYAEFSAEAAVEHLECLPDGATVNWSETAERFGIQYKNKGQVLNEQMHKRGIQTDRFEIANKRKLNTEYKRRVRRCVDGTNIAMPKHKSVSQLKEEISEKVTSREINIGRSVELDDVVMQVKDLLQIRLNLLQQELGFRLKRSQWAEEKSNICQQCSCEFSENEEKLDHLNKIINTRYFKIWTDGSSVANAQHTLICLSRIYSTAYYLTPQEISTILGKNMDIQSMVEQPVVIAVA